MQLSNDIRRTFLDYFAKNGHERCPSASLIPNDPTLLFVNAGMVPFKELFTGKEKRGYTRAASSQKCIRISGKHNDLENVGQTARHHTFFEMLGNFSFGDYFKEEAIFFAWELLTKHYDLPQERMIISVFGGEDDLAADEEARELWKKVTGFGDNRIPGMGKADNFWQMGDTGPCGPCSEVHFWLGPIPKGGVPFERFGEEPDPNGHGWFEIWNLVFMQYEWLAKDGGFVLNNLPAPSIDTGAGLERLASVLQDVTTNYDTDLLRALVDRASEISKKKYTGSQSDDDVSMRVIADHARTAAFLIAEGIFPDRGGREYVLRRVMRRAIRHGHRLGIAEPFLHTVALDVVASMGGYFPELVERKELISKMIFEEEVRFRETIDRGLKILDDELRGVEKGAPLAGDTAFKLYDTYGFPLDLTQVICKERGFEVDGDGYDAALAEARKRSEGSTLNKDAFVEAAYHEAAAKLPEGGTEFLGYTSEVAKGRVVALISDGKLTDEVVWKGGTGPLPKLDVIVDRTPFYGRGGGQEGDEGEIRVIGGKGRVLVETTTKPVDGMFVHHGSLAQGGLKVGDEVELVVTHDARTATRRNHSATHLLHWALAEVLGPHVEQKGSLVAPETLRFDFSHNKSMTQGEVEQVENLVNQKILENAPAVTEVLGIAEARAKGARAIFEEKYGDVVRVLTITADSVELCGGTHVEATGEIGMFKIVSEGGVAAGVRRIEAVTGDNAVSYVREQEELLRAIAKATKANGPKPRVATIQSLMDRVRELEKEKEALQRKLAMGGGGGIDSMLSQAVDISGVKVLSVNAQAADAKTLRELAEKLRDKLGTAIVVAGAAVGPKAMLVAMVSKDVTKRLKAGDLIRPVAKIVGGRGGGRPDMAQAGGADVAKLADALAAVPKEVESLLGASA